MNNSHLIQRLSEDYDWKTLNQKQQDFCVSVLKGNNVFLTGAAGVGKSHVLQFIFNFLEKNNIYFGKTALSGIAALNIGGSTIHSFSGIGLANTDIQDIFKNVYRNKKARLRLESVKILFIDEISMASGNLFNILDKVFKAVRRIKAPFGGVQVVISGDLFQIPYIPSDLQNQDDYVFESSSWKNLNLKTVELVEVVRQKDDQEFVKILNEIRVGNIENIGKIEERVGAKLDLKEGIRPVRLLGYNRSVETWNKKLLDAIPGKSVLFHSKERGEPYHKEYFDKNCPSPSVLELKSGCQVSLTYNIDTEGGLVNGLLGKVVGFEEKNVVVKFVNGEKAIITPQKWEIKEQYTDPQDGELKYRAIASRTQIPLRLAFASSIHRAQGSTLEYVEIDLNQVFSDGMGYSALSRVKNLKGLSIINNFNPYKITANPKCIKFYNSINKED